MLVWAVLVVDQVRVGLWVDIGVRVSVSVCVSCVSGWCWCGGQGKDGWAGGHWCVSMCVRACLYAWAVLLVAVKIRPD